MLTTTSLKSITTFSEIDFYLLNQTGKANQKELNSDKKQNNPSPFAVWQAQCLTGNHLIDEQHQTLFYIINELHRELHTDANPSQLKSILTEIKLHTIEHFEYEEELMRSHHYPDYKRHKRVHDNLLEKVSKILAQMDQFNNFVPKENLTNFLTQWLIHHIQGEDQNMIKFLRPMTITKS